MYKTSYKYTKPFCKYDPILRQSVIFAEVHNIYDSNINVYNVLALKML